MNTSDLPVSEVGKSDHCGDTNPNELKITLSDIMKQYEWQHVHLIPKKFHFMVRLDGKNFSTFTRGFKQKDSKNPFDPNFQQAMINTMNDLVLKFSSVATGYVHSDEITLVFPSKKIAQKRDT